jgi:uncharacterized RDD family membrane protein YckC
MEKEKAVTAEVHTNLEKVGFGTRFLAFLIDAILLGTVNFVLMQIGLKQQLIPTIIGAAYTIYFWMNMNGQTLGKKAMGIKVVRIDGKPLDATCNNSCHSLSWIYVIRTSIICWIFLDYLGQKQTRFS